MLNRVILIGKVQRAETDFTPNGTVVLKITLRTWDTPETQFHHLVFYDSEGDKAYRYAEILNSPDFDGYLMAEGQIRYRTYTAKDGTNRRLTEIVVRNIKLISPRNGKNEKSERKEIIPESEEMKKETPGLNRDSTVKTEERKTTKPVGEEKIEKKRPVKPALEEIITPEIEEIEKELSAVDDMDIPF